MSERTWVVSFILNTTRGHTRHLANCHDVAACRRVVAALSLRRRRDLVVAAVGAFFTAAEPRLELVGIAVGAVLRDLRAAVGDAVADADDAGHGLGPARSKQQQQRQESRERASRPPPRLHRAIRYRASMLVRASKFAGSHAASDPCTAL